MATRIYYLTSDNGDGSASVHFYRDGEGVKDKLEALCEDDPETYGGNDGGNDGGPDWFEIEGSEVVGSIYGTGNFFSDIDEDEG